MFLNTVLRPTLDLFRYPGRLVVCVDTDGRQECGLFSGRHAGFSGREHLSGVRQPTIEEEEWRDTGSELFEVSGLPRPEGHELLQYHFVAISWRNAVYCEYPHGEELVVTATTDGWHLAYLGIDVVLEPSYGAPV